TLHTRLLVSLVPPFSSCAGGSGRSRRRISASAPPRTTAHLRISTEGGGANPPFRSLRAGLTFGGPGSTVRSPMWGEEEILKPGRARVDRAAERAVTAHRATELLGASVDECRRARTPSVARSPRALAGGPTRYRRNGDVED